MKKVLFTLLILAGAFSLSGCVTTRGTNALYDIGSKVVDTAQGEAKMLTCKAGSDRYNSELPASVYAAKAEYCNKLGIPILPPGVTLTETVPATEAEIQLGVLGVLGE